MRMAVAVERLREAFAALREEREDKGAGLVFKDVWTRAEVPKATAYRENAGFRKEFDAAVAALRSVGAASTPVHDELGRLADYRALVAQLANQVQLLSLALETERRRNGAPSAVGANVLPFPTMRDKG